MVKRIIAPKPRNGGTMTESAFWGWIRSMLRNKSRFWIPRIKCLQEARRPNQSDNKRLKWEFQCNVCNKWFQQKQVEVHHIKEAGTLKCAQDLPLFVENLFSEKGWACLCKECHKNIHKNKSK